MSMAEGLSMDMDEFSKSATPTTTAAGGSTVIHTDKESFNVGEINHGPLVPSDEEADKDAPSEGDLHTLRRVSGHINWAAFTIAFCEFCERFSYYGSSVLYTNYIQHPLPTGSATGAGGADGQSGVLGMGQQASTGLGNMNMFLSYLTPLLGAYLADARLGRYKVIHIAIAVATVAHVVLTVSALPTVVTDRHGALAAFLIGLLLLALGTGLFKANVGSLLAEQTVDTRMRVEVRNGERVLIDPAITNSRIFLYFYFSINIGSLIGQLGMVFVEKYHSFWLAFLLPTILFAFAPFVLFSNRKRYILKPPTGFVLSKCFKMWGFVMRGKWTLNLAKLKREFSWDIARPSNIPVEQRPAWMTYDDAWVDEVRRGLKACKVFLFLPVFFLAYNQMTTNLTSQASTMKLGKVPNDLIQNFNPITILFTIPFFDFVLYPGLRRMGINFTPLKRMCTGFFVASLSMVAAAVMQYYIYKASPCGWHAGNTGCDPAPINVWSQMLPYILIGVAEIFTNTTSYEYAYSKAPENMKSLVMAINLFMNAISSAIGQAFTPISADPYLVWNYMTVALIAFFGGIGFWVCFRQLDRDEDKWNMIARSSFVGSQRRQQSFDVTHLASENGAGCGEKS